MVLSQMPLVSFPNLRDSTRNITMLLKASLSPSQLMMLEDTSTRESLGDEVTGEESEAAQSDLI